MSNEKYDLVIIGAGPAGLASAIEAQRAGLSYIVIDKGSVADSIRRFQRNMYFFSTPELLEIGGVPFVVPTTRPTSLDCVNYYRRVTDLFSLNCVFYEKIVSAVRKDGEFIVRAGSGRTFSSQYLVAANGYYDTPSRLDIAGEDLPHVTHYYRDPLPYYRQNVLVVGGKNSAVEAALDLWRHGARVTLIHRGSKLSEGVKYWILPDFENRAAAGAISVHFNSSVKEFSPGRTVVQTEGREPWELKTDFAFVLIGYRPDLPFLRSLGIEVEPDSLAPCFNPATMETNVPGLYVAGGMVGGKFNNKVFIENGRTHGKIIVDSIVGRPVRPG